MGRIWNHKKWMIVAAALLVLIVAGVVGSLGAASNKDNEETRVATPLEASRSGSGAVVSDQTSSSESVAALKQSDASGSSGSYAPEQVSTGGVGLDVLAKSSGQKVVSNGQVEIKVGSGAFEKAYDQALLIATRYGGYVVSSTSQAGGEEDGLKSGSIAIKIPSTSFANAMADASKIGELKNRNVSTEDVTEEYVDLEARIANSKAHVQSLLALLAKAKTVDEILQVQQVLSSAQQELEQLEGRKRYLDENTSYSTLTMSIYEEGVVVAAAGGWGVTQAFKDALHNLVGGFNAVIRGLGVLVPVLAVIAIVFYIVYAIWRASVRRRRRDDAAQPEK